jgi:3-oxoacyl-[acyl-carrier protein] reductase
MRVVVNYLRNGTAAKEVVADIEAAGGQAMAVQADVREAAAVESMIEQVQAAWGGIDVLVHNALTPYVIKPFRDMTWEELGGKLDDEMRAAFAVTKAVLPAMTEQDSGRIIYLSTGLSRQPREGMITLGTAKAALAQFARYLAQELGPRGITVNVVEPGPVEDTRMAADVIDEEHKQRQVAAIPLGRLAHTGDVAQVVALLRQRGQRLHDRHHGRGQRRDVHVLTLRCPAHTGPYLSRSGRRPNRIRHTVTSAPRAAPAARSGAWR